MDEPSEPKAAILSAYDEQLEKIRLALADRKLDKVALQTGLHENTVRAIFNKKNPTPSLTTIEKLSKYLWG